LVIYQESLHDTHGQQNIKKIINSFALSVYCPI